MLDFLLISTKSSKRGVIEIYPKFIIKKSSDLMIRGGDFYAIWIDEKDIWSTDEQDALQLIDQELDAYAEKNKDKFEANIRVLHMWDSDSGMIDSWHKYCQKQMRDSYHMLDEKLIFSNDVITKKDYASKRLNYPLEKTDISNYNKLMNVLYSPEERRKIEWAIGSIVNGDSKKIQKFLVLYGGAGTGKSTVLNIIQKLFDGYYTVFDARALGSSSNSFALEAFKTNPLVAIQHDGDLSHIEDNTRLNSLVSHELMTVNEKFKATYTSRFKCFLFMGTNKPVKITDAKSGLLRRLIDVSPSGEKIGISEYRKIIKNIDFELGGIAMRCKDIYEEDPNYYDDYVPINMMGASNDFYNFMLDSYLVFSKENGCTLKQAWEMYKVYCDDAKVPYAMSQRVFKEELKNYFDEYHDRSYDDKGTRIRSYYSGFKTSKFKEFKSPKKKKEEEPSIIFKEQASQFDDICKDCLAQYATKDETPSYKWANVKSTLGKLDTSKLHYVKVPENHIVIDFDIPDKDGNKDFKANLREASKWPATYAELSKSGSGIHLHYIYTGDPQKLSRVYDDYIEIKVFTGNSSLRRKLTKCNDIPIASISSGLPLKGEKEMVNFNNVKSEKALRAQIIKCLRKEYPNVPSTSQNINLIYSALEDAYTSGMHYDVNDMRNAILTFAANSTHQAKRCTDLVAKMHFRSEEPSEVVNNEDAKMIFYDVEVFPNLLLINYKIQEDYTPDDFGSWDDYIHEFSTNHKPVVRMINPSPKEVEDLMQFRLVGFNCRRYDNHILYGRMMGYSNEQIFNLSKSIIVDEDKPRNDVFFKEAYNISYTDVYDFSTKKQSLKKWEIELGIHHQELGLPWDEPVDEKLWPQVAEYCDNDVIATEAVFNARRGDFTARQIQVDLVKSLHNITNVSVNDTTNSLSGKMIFGKDRMPQEHFNYRDLSKPVGSKEYTLISERFGENYIFNVFDENGLPTYKQYNPIDNLPKGYSILPFFPGYTFDAGKSIYLGEEIGEGGRVYAVPGMYKDIWDGDVASMHPHSIIYECLFGPEYTKRFEDIVNARVAIKHKDLELAGTMLDGCLKPYLTEEHCNDLAQALKIVVNSIYGLTSAKFANLFKDPRNKDNIVAKRGALFMTLLKQEVEKRGFKVAHIKTDSIKIPNATQEIKDFVIKFGKEYGYSFETEGDFLKFCLINNAVYIAFEKDEGWIAVGKEFQIPYVYKTLFSKEPIEFKDLCITQECKTALYLDMNEKLGPDEHDYHYIGRIGEFCPMKSGCGAGTLLRIEKDGERYSAATGSKGFLWMESEMVKTLGLEDQIDRNYFDILVNGAIEEIEKAASYDHSYGDVEWFRGNDISDGSLKSDPLPDGWENIK